MADSARREVVGDVSAMASAAGGVIAYVVTEQQRSPRQPAVPTGSRGVDPGEYTREWPIQVTNRIEPRILGLGVEPVPLGRESGVACLATVSEGSAAHQALDDRYSRRYGI